MKHLLIHSILAISLSSVVLAADAEKSKAARDDAFASVPNFDYWDANAWESGSGASFWNDTATAVTPTVPEPTGENKAGKSRKQKKAASAGN
jgi:hypothetical protein